MSPPEGLKEGKKPGWLERKRPEWHREKAIIGENRDNGYPQSIAVKIRGFVLSVLTMRYSSPPSPLRQLGPLEESPEAKRDPHDEEPDFEALWHDYAETIAIARTDEERALDVPTAEKAITNLKRLNGSFVALANKTIAELSEVIRKEIISLRETQSALQAEKDALTSDKKGALSPEESEAYDALIKRVDKFLAANARNIWKVQYVTVAFLTVHKSLVEALAIGSEDLVAAQAELERRELLESHVDIIDELEERVQRHGFFADVRLPMQLAARAQRLEGILGAVIERHEGHTAVLGEALFGAADPVLSGMRELSPQGKGGEAAFDKAIDTVRSMETRISGLLGTGQKELPALTRGNSASDEDAGATIQPEEAYGTLEALEARLKAVARGLDADKTPNDDADIL